MAIGDKPKSRLVCKLSKDSKELVCAFVKVDEQNKPIEVLGKVVISTEGGSPNVKEIEINYNSTDINKIKEIAQQFLSAISDITQLKNVEPISEEIEDLFERKGTKIEE